MIILQSNTRHFGSTIYLKCIWKSVLNKWLVLLLSTREFKGGNPVFCRELINGGTFLCIGSILHVLLSVLSFQSPRKNHVVRWIVYIKSRRLLIYSRYVKRLDIAYCNYSYILIYILIYYKCFCMCVNYFAELCQMSECSFQMY